MTEDEYKQRLELYFIIISNLIEQHGGDLIVKYDESIINRADGFKIHFNDKFDQCALKLMKYNDAPSSSH